MLVFLTKSIRFDCSQIIVEGVAGSSDTGDIALDDLKTVVGECAPPGWCDFERSFCSWVNILAPGQCK